MNTQTHSISTHILDLHSGCPAEGVAVELRSPSYSQALMTGVTNEDGRVVQWSEKVTLVAGTWSMRFDIKPWFLAQNRDCFFEDISLSFNISDVERSYHVPLLLNQFGYSTYRGS